MTISRRPLQEAAQWIAAHPEQAADTYLRVTGAKTDRALLLEIIRSPEVQFRIAPQNTFGLATFLHRVGAIRNQPHSVADYFFPDPHVAAGS